MKLLETITRGKKFHLMETKGVAFVPIKDFVRDIMFFVSFKGTSHKTTTNTLLLKKTKTKES